MVANISLKSMPDSFAALPAYWIASLNLVMSNWLKFIAWVNSLTIFGKFDALNWNAPSVATAIWVVVSSVDPVATASRDTLLSDCWISVVLKPAWANVVAAFARSIAPNLLSFATSEMAFFSSSIWVVVDWEIAWTVARLSSYCLMNWNVPDSKFWKPFNNK